MINYYYCPYCDEAWDDEWDCACDDECPQCGKDFTPFDDEDARERTIDTVRSFKAQSHENLS